MLSHHLLEHLDPHLEQPLKETDEHRRNIMVADVVLLEILEENLTEETDISEYRIDGYNIINSEMKKSLGFNCSRSEFYDRLW